MEGVRWITALRSGGSTNSFSPKPPYSSLYSLLPDTVVAVLIWMNLHIVTQ